MVKEMHGPLRPSPVYAEYALFCEQENFTPVPREYYTAQMWLDICIDYGVANAINDENGVPWAEHVKDFKNMFARSSSPDEPKTYAEYLIRHNARQ